MKNNIVLIMSRLGFGGAERVSVSFCNWIVENTNDKVTILKFDNDDSAYELDDRVNVINFEKNSSNRVMAIINRYRFCKKNLKKLNANLVFAMFYQTELYAYFSKPCNCKVIGSERCNVLELSNLKKHITYYAAKKCDGFIFQTEGIKKTFPIKVQKNSIVISNAISNKKVYDINVHNKENVITAMGRLNSQKGFDTLIKAFSIVNKKNSSYTLKIFGEGPDRDTLQNLIDTAGLHDYVQLCGAKSDAINDVANSKIFVLSSRYEGMPNALIEAMAAGTACISTDCKFGPSELISDGKNGLLTPVDDVRTLSEKILFLIENETVRRNIEKNAIEIRKKLDANTIYKKYYDYFVGVKNEK
jgi:glycosyltransferase protein